MLWKTPMSFLYLVSLHNTIDKTKEGNDPEWIQSSERPYYGQVTKHKETREPRD